MTINKILAGTLAAGALALGVSTIAVAAPADAHTPEATATCSTLTVALESYSLGSDGSFVNRITVAIDSTLVDESDFGSSLHEAYSLGDSAVTHEYRVDIDASGTRYDRSFSGNSVPCPKAAVPDAGAALSIVPATCTANGALVLGETTNASWGAPTTAVGPGPYAVAATADAGHTFPDGTTTATYTGTLAAMLAPDDVACAAVVPERPEPVRDVVIDTALDCGSATRTTTTTSTFSDWALDSGTNTWLPTPPVIATTTTTVGAAPGECATTVGVTPADPDVEPAAAAADVEPAPVLAATGSDAAAVAPIGLAVLLAGVALTLSRRIGARRAAEKR